VDPQFHHARPAAHRQRDQHFLAAIHTLQQLKTTFTPGQKLGVIGDMFRAVTGSSQGVTWSMDILLPVCMYVVVRARVLQLGAELAMLQVSTRPSRKHSGLFQELMEDFLFHGEQGIMLTTLLAAYHQMLRESVFINWCGKACTLYQFLSIQHQMLPTKVQLPTQARSNPSNPDQWQCVIFIKRTCVDIVMTRYFKVTCTSVDIRL
jgi:hypothetical protein